MDPANMSNQIDFQIAEMIFNLMGRYTYDPPLGNAINAELAESGRSKTTPRLGSSTFARA